MKTTRLLDRIDEPRDLKKLSRDELFRLPQDLRREIIRAVSHCGGHLASSLGVVELTVALYRVFDLPSDKVIWDVGHQAYAHKLLTGRRKAFKTLRQLGGIIGFPLMSESPYDFFGTGHASTSISAALGMAAARDHRGGKEKIIACLGDGALTGGTALEALNQGCRYKNILVVLNANEMAISPSVGAISEYLNRIISAPFYNRLKAEMSQMMEKIPAIGSRMVEMARKLEESVKGLITPGIIFEEFGYRYFGPVDGHNLDALLEILDNIRHIEDPILLHVVTKKGRGYRPAEEHPEVFHGTSPFHVKTGRPLKLSRFLSYSEVFGETIVSLAPRVPEMVAVTAAMCSGTGLDNFARRFPDRFFDVGIAEGHALTFAAGMASRGLRPVVAVYSTFLQRGYDQIVHDICLQNLPVVLAVDRAGLVGEDGATHQGVFDIAFLRHIPNLVLIQPRDGKELSGLLAAAISHAGPVAIRYPRGESELVKVEPPFPEYPWARSELVREGEEGEIWAIGAMVETALQAAEILKERGRDFGVVNTRFIKPLDGELLRQSAASGHKVVSLEEHALAGGLGSALWECLENSGMGSTPMLRIGIADRFVEHGSVAELRHVCGLTPEKVADNILRRFPQR